jgi:putative FmdB family regulatory protein
MPLHDFRCRACGHVFEALVRSGWTTACAACGSEDLERLPSTFAVSSDTSRRASVQAARSKAEQARAGRRHEEHAAMRQHLTDHH